MHANKFLSLWLVVILCFASAVSGIFAGESANGKKVGKGKSVMSSAQKSKLISQILTDNFFKNESLKLDDSDVQKKMYAKLAEKMILDPTGPAIDLTNGDKNSLVIQSALNDRTKRMKELRKQLEEDVAKQYPVEKKGSLVVLNFRQGPYNRSIRGIYHGCVNGFVKIDDKLVPVMDIANSVRIRFDEEYNREQRKKIITGKMSDFLFEEDKKITLFNEKAGYVYDTRQMKWCSAREFADALIQKEIVKRQKKAARLEAKRKKEQLAAEKKRLKEEALKKQREQQEQAQKQNSANAAAEWENAQKTLNAYRDGSLPLPEGKRLIRCPDCGGTGKAFDKPCRQCAATGAALCTQEVIDTYNWQDRIIR